MIKLGLCKIHYNKLVEYQEETGDLKNIQPERVNIADCYYCKSNIEIVTQRYNTADGLSRDIGSDCEGGVCPVR